ncbi:MAG: apolipoprotein N-acyltransferase [Cyclobacteriaceae bacterium]|nr:apolipoprotein N-acyltransferase [Cyclobacteriaceae bacterium]
MPMPFLLWFLGSRHLNYKIFHFIFIWLTFEYIHFHWSLSWPWLTFGHIFGAAPQVVQWYEFTGVLGGTLWVLVVGYFIYSYFNTSNTKQNLLYLILVIALPLIISYWLNNKDKTQIGTTLKVSVVQTGFALNDSIYYSNFNKIKYLTSKFRLDIPKNVDYILLPEFALGDSIMLTNIRTSMEVELLKKYLTKYHSLNTRMILGLELSEYQKNTNTKFKYNALIEIDYQGLKNVYVKNKYIPFQERTPYGFGFLNISSEEYSRANTPTQKFYNKQLNFNPILAICYESIYGYYLNSQVKPTPSAIFMFSSEAFLNNSVGVEQYFNISKLRAIELRREIARSSNMGYSAIIDSKGSIKRLSNKENFEIINGVIHANDSLTFYAKYGDYIGVISFIILLFLTIKPIAIRVCYKIPPSESLAEDSEETRNKSC